MAALAGAPSVRDMPAPLRPLLLLALAAAVFPVELTANARFEIALPELGDTEDGGKARVGIRLPTDFDARRRFPGIVAFGGGAGGSNPDLLHSIIGGTGFIVIALPYKKGEIWGSPLGWYRPMLERAFAEVPNINREVLVTAGFSSGGGATGVTTFTKEGMDLFCATIPAGLNPFPAPPGQPCFRVIDHPRFVGFPILAIIGAEDRTRIADMRRFRDAAAATKVDLTYIEMPGVGHSWDKSSWPQVRAFLQEKVVDRQRRLALAAMDAAVAGRRHPIVLAQAGNVLGLCADDHADAARARAAIAQVEESAAAAYAALGEQARPKALGDFAAAWAGTASGLQAKERYDVLAAAAASPAEPAAGEAQGKVEQWVRGVASFARAWPGSAAAAAAQDAVGRRLDAELASILAMEAGPKQRRSLLAFIKAFPEQPAGRRAQAEAQRMDAELKRKK